MIVAAVPYFPHNNHVLKIGRSITGMCVVFLLSECLVTSAETHHWMRNGKHMYLLNEISRSEKRWKLNWLPVNFAIQICAFGTICCLKTQCF